MEETRDKREWDKGEDRPHAKWREEQVSFSLPCLSPTYLWFTTLLELVGIVTNDWGLRGCAAQRSSRAGEGSCPSRGGRSLL